MKMLKTLWNTVLAITVYETFKGNDDFRKIIVLILHRIKDLIVYLLDKIK